MEFTREDHDRISRIASEVISLAVSVKALDRFVVEARASDRRALEIADAAQKDALSLARREMDARLEKVNEFREALADAQSRMMPRLEVNLLIGNLTSRLDEVAGQVTALLGQVIEMRSAGAGRDSGQDRYRASLAAIVAVAGLVLAVVVYATR